MTVSFIAGRNLERFSNIWSISMGWQKRPAGVARLSCAKYFSDASGWPTQISSEYTAPGGQHWQHGDASFSVFHVFEKCLHTYDDRIEMYAKPAMRNLYGSGGLCVRR